VASQVQVLNGLQRLASRNWALCRTDKSRHHVKQRYFWNPSNIHARRTYLFSCFVTRCLLYSKHLEKKFNVSRKLTIKSINTMAITMCSKALIPTIKSGRKGISIIGKKVDSRQKVTLLPLIFNGLEQYQEAGLRLTGKEYHRRHFKFAVSPWASAWFFQSFNLFPHMTWAKNVMLAPNYGLKKSKAEAETGRLAPCWKKSTRSRNSIASQKSFSGGQAATCCHCPSLGESPKVLLCWRNHFRTRSRTGREVLKVLEQLSPKKAWPSACWHMKWNFARDVRHSRVVFIAPRQSLGNKAILKPSYPIHRQTNWKTIYGSVLL